MDPNSWILNGGGWFALALVNAGLAEQKNRSRLTWFLLSLFIGPFATLFVVIWPRAKKMDPHVVLHPISNLVDRYLIVGTVLLLAALFAIMIAAVSASGWIWTIAAVLLGAGMLSLVLCRRASRRAPHRVVAGS